MITNKYSLFSKFYTMLWHYTQVLVTNGCLFSVKSLEFLYRLNGNNFTTTVHCHQKEQNKKKKKKKSQDF